MEDRAQAVKRLRELIETQKIAMLTTIDDDGSLHSRPMWTEEFDDEARLWFLTNRSSHKVHELSQNRRVNVSYADPQRDHYVSVSGMARLVDDRSKARLYWSARYRAWFPHGPEDEDLVVLCVDVDKAEYWDRTSRRMAQLAALVKAVLTGKRAEPKGNVEVVPR